MSLEEMVGKKVNRLKVIKFLETRGNGKKKRRYWECLCDCGNTVVASTASINFGLVKSCGCLRVEVLRKNNTLPIGEASFNQLYKSYRKKAKEKNLDFLLTKDDFKTITMMNCFYCGRNPSNISKSRSETGDYVYNGIDRIDNRLGYTIDNTVPCCKRCNISKNNMEIGEFKEMIINIYENFIQGVKK